MVFLFVLASLSSVLFLPPFPFTPLSNPHSSSLSSSSLPFLSTIPIFNRFLFPLPPPPSSPPPLPSLVPILSFSTEEYTVGEGTDNATVVITRQGDTAVPITVMLNSEPINATGE